MGPQSSNWAVLSDFFTGLQEAGPGGSGAGNLTLWRLLAIRVGLGRCSRVLLPFVCLAAAPENPKGACCGAAGFS